MKKISLIFLLCILILSGFKIYNMDKEIRSLKSVKHVDYKKDIEIINDEIIILKENDKKIENENVSIKSDIKQIKNNYSDINNKISDLKSFDNNIKKIANQTFGKDQFVIEVIKFLKGIK